MGGILTKGRAHAAPGRRFSTHGQACGGIYGKTANRTGSQTRTIGNSWEIVPVLGPAQPGSGSCQQANNALRPIRCGEMAPPFRSVSRRGIFSSSLHGGNNITCQHGFEADATDGSLRALSVAIVPASSGPAVDGLTGAAPTQPGTAPATGRLRPDGSNVVVDLGPLSDPDQDRGCFRPQLWCVVRQAGLLIFLHE